MKESNAKKAAQDYTDAEILAMLARIFGCACGTATRGSRVG